MSLEKQTCRDCAYLDKTNSKSDYAWCAFHALVIPMGGCCDDLHLSTCTKCVDKDTCRSAFDLYNTNGDCLETK